MVRLRCPPAASGVLRITSATARRGLLAGGLSARDKEELEANKRRRVDAEASALTGCSRGAWRTDERKSCKRECILVFAAGRCGYGCRLRQRLDRSVLPRQMVKTVLGDARAVRVKQLTAVNAGAGVSEQENIEFAMEPVSDVSSSYLSGPMWAREGLLCWRGARRGVHGLESGFDSDEVVIVRRVVGWARCRTWRRPTRSWPQPRKEVAGIRESEEDPGTC